jgi:hypothetical protein
VVPTINAVGSCWVTIRAVHPAVGARMTKSYVLESSQVFMWVPIVRVVVVAKVIIRLDNRIL